ncbi:MAG: hypothetical protein HUU35_04630, partial [Armatimonadetes bacterium]|nr:hypothetical protein [Armatimonadota bacterium]
MSRYLSCFLLCLAPLGAAQVELGDWSLDYDTGRLGSLRYRGELVVSQSSLTGFLPEWKGTRFGLARQAPEVTRAADRLDLRFPIETPGHASGAVVVAFTETEVSWRLEAQIEPTGPVEFGLYLPSATFCREDGSCALRLNGREVEYDSSTRPATNVSRLLLPRPGWDLVWSFNSTPGYWAFQDHRATTAKAFRAIASATINAPTKLVAEARLKVIPAAPERVEARRATQAQRSRWTASVPLENAGFEAGGAGWALPANGAVEEGNAHGGERAARLTVKDPSTEAVYITRQVPITGGSYYQARAFVRTQGVVRTEGKMASVGAGLILEWADKNGKWYAAGGYATELWGDKPWTVRETELLRAPEEAAYAVVFLALRGAGTAWFDDVELTEVHRALLLSDPAPGTTLADNTPRLVWAEDPRTMSYTVELSQDPAFPDASTQRLPSERAELEVPEPLAKGTWHWRVRAPGYEPGATWHFEQTADPAADTTAPRITATPVRVTSANEQVRVAVTDTAPGVKVSAALGETALTPRLSERDGRCEVGLQG